MKLLALALLAAVGFAGVLSTQTAWERHLAAVVSGVELRVDDEPPPVDCPFCGGNPTQHLRNMRRMFVFQSRLVLGAALAR